MALPRLSRPAADHRGVLFVLRVAPRTRARSLGGLVGGEGLRRDLYRARVKAAVVRTLRFAARAGPVGLAAGTSGSIGFVIGWGANAIFYPIHTSNPWTGQITFSERQAGSYAGHGSQKQLTQDALVVQWYTGSQWFETSYPRATTQYDNVTHRTYDCAPVGITTGPPRSARVFPGPWAAGATGLGCHPGLDETFDDSEIYVIDASSVDIGVATTPPPGEPTDVSAPPDPGLAAVKQAAREILGDDVSYPHLNAWLDYLLGVPGARDPFSEGFNMPDCTGMSQSECVSLLRTYEIEPAFETLAESNTDYPDGAVVESKPTPGTPVTADAVMAVIAVNPQQRVGSEADQRCEMPDRTAPYPAPGAPSDGSAYPVYQPAPSPWNGPYLGVDPSRGRASVSIPLRGTASNVPAPRRAGAGSTSRRSTASVRASRPRFAAPSGIPCRRCSSRA